MYAEPVPVPLPEARRRWAELLRRIFEVEPLECQYGTDAFGCHPNVLSLAVSQTAATAGCWIFRSTEMA